MSKPQFKLLTMLSFFKSNKKKTITKGRAFYERESLIQTIDEIIDILSHLDTKKNTIKSKHPIQFQNKALDSIIEKELEKDFGEESFILHPNNDIEGHVVYYYRIRSEYLRFLIQLHFIDGEFFLASTKVYADVLLSKKDKQSVLSNIYNKYCPQIECSDSEIEIVDPEGNILWTKDDVFFHINYLHNNKCCKKLLKQYLGLGKPKPGQEIKNTLDDLI